MDFEPFVRWFRHAFAQNLGLKAIALVFALGFYSYVHGQENIQQRTLPISVVTLPPDSGGKVLMTKIPPNIHITLRGPGRALTELVQGGVRQVEVDLRDGHPQEIVFTREMFRLPGQLEMLEVVPHSLVLEWEDLITRQVPLQASITGELADGFILKGVPRVEPDRITVKGPRRTVEVMQFVRLAPYNVTGLTEGLFPRRIAIDPPGDQVEHLGTPAATVVVEVKRRESEKLFSDLPIQVIGPGRGAKVLPATVDVTVIGPPDVVRALRAEQIIPKADLVAAHKWSPERTGSGSADVPIQVDLARVTVEVQPPNATVSW